MIGAERGFPGLKQVQENFNAQFKMNFPIYPDLEMTVAAGVGVAMYREPSIPAM